MVKKIAHSVLVCVICGLGLAVFDAYEFGFYRFLISFGSGVAIEKIWSKP